jgi:dipeptidyl aminopeptidase/acylaminoacyl peptidase
VYLCRLFVRRMVLAAAALASMGLAHAQAPLTIEDINSELNVVDTSISPSGRYLAAVIRRKDDDMIITVDLKNGEKKPVTRINKDSYGGQIDARISAVYWKTDDRLLFRLHMEPDEDLSFNKLSRGSILKLGKRLIAINRDGTKLTPMLGEQYNEALVGAFDTSNIQSLLKKDPSHILMNIGGWDGRSLFKVNVDTGEGKVVEKQKESVRGWWLDADGNAIVRVESSVGTLRFYHKQADGSWKKVYSTRTAEFEEREEFESIGPSKDPTKYYVLARPVGHDRYSVFLYDLAREDFGAPLVQNATYDLFSAETEPDGSGIRWHCYYEHVVMCDFSDPKVNAYMRGLRKFFNNEASVIPTERSSDGNTILLYVYGPSEPPSYYYYLVDQKKIEFLGLRQGAMADKARVSTEVITWKARDGLELTGYLTRPPGAKDVKKLPLVLMPHGGPHARDYMDFDPWVQLLAARGYAVFQPNFRGSDGFGKEFMQRGYRERGKKMQDDLGDGVKALAEREAIDPSRVCIVGASYGGYAALAGAALTPNDYKCAVSIAGVSDLIVFSKWRRSQWGKDSEGYAFSVESLGDFEKEAAEMQAVSPALKVAAIKIPILLIHGADDNIVPYEQSEIMQKALQAAGRKTELIKLEKQGHPHFEHDEQMVAMSAVDDFLWQHLGPGLNSTTKPKRYVISK